MRKQSVIVRCDGDGCKEVGEVAELRDTPSGWYHVKQADDMDKLKSDGFDFHSLRCVEKWAKGRRIILNGSGSSEASETLWNLLPDLGGEFTSSDIQELSGLAQSTVDRWLVRWTEEGKLSASGSMPRVYEVL